MRGSKVTAPLLLVSLVAGASLSAASVLYEYVLGTHAHGVLQPLTLAIDALGALLAGLFALELMAAYGYVPMFRRQAAIHTVLAWPILAAVALHGAAATWHALQPPREGSPLALSAMGVALLAMLGWQAYEGRFGRPAEATAKRRRLVRHTIIGLAAGGLVLAHVLLGTWHAISG